jgi:cysteine synthase A
MDMQGTFPRHLVGGTPVLMVRVRAPRPATLRLKLESFNPYGSIKDRTAVALFDSVAAQLDPGVGLVESTSGNLGVALAALARSSAVPFTAVVDPLTSRDTVARMRELDADVVEVTEVDGAGGYLLNRLRRVRELLSQRPGLSWTNQYDNPANPRAHALGTGPELGAQIAPDSVVLVPVSTGGTLAGIRTYAQQHRPGWTVIGVDVYGSNALGHSEGARLIPGIGSSRHSGFVAEHGRNVMRVDSTEAVAACVWLLAEAGVGVGGSSGALVAAALRLIARGAERDIACVCPDGARNYLDTVYCATWRTARSIPDHLIDARVDSVERLVTASRSAAPERAGSPDSPLRRRQPPASPRR